MMAWTRKETYMENASFASAVSCSKFGSASVSDTGVALPPKRNRILMIDSVNRQIRFDRISLMNRPCKSPVYCQWLSWCSVEFITSAILGRSCDLESRNQEPRNKRGESAGGAKPGHLHDTGNEPTHLDDRVDGTYFTGTREKSPL